MAEAARFAETLRRYYYVTPKNYLDYIQNYHSQLSYNEKKVGNSVKRLAGGLSKLVDAARDVDRMSIELKDAQVIVSAKTVEVEALIEQITEKTTIANKQKDEAEIMQVRDSVLKLNLNLPGSQRRRRRGCESIHAGHCE